MRRKSLNAELATTVGEMEVFKKVVTRWWSVMTEAWEECLRLKAMSTVAQKH